MTSLQELHINNAAFTTFSDADTAFFDRTLRLLDASDNPYKCSCSSTSFIKWFNDADVINDKHKYYYRYPCNECPVKTWTDDVPDVKGVDALSFTIRNVMDLIFSMYPLYM